MKILYLSCNGLWNAWKRENANSSQKSIFSLIVIELPFCRFNPKGACCGTFYYQGRKRSPVRYAVPRFVIKVAKGVQSDTL